MTPQQQAAQLPTPPPGMRWHREDGWQEGDLPQGWRPLVKGEKSPPTDEIRRGHEWTTLDRPSDVPEIPADEYTSPCRTQRPLTFTHAGKQWTWHRLGDPIPCDGERRIHIICHEGRTEDKTGCRYLDRLARNNLWEKTLGWRYADDEAEATAPTFEQAGKRWTRHTPGDPIPCAGTEVVEVLLADGHINCEGWTASRVRWSKGNESDVIGWRRAEISKPVDVPTASLSRTVAEWEVEVVKKWNEVRASKGHFIAVYTPQVGHARDIVQRRETAVEVRLWTTQWFKERGHEIEAEIMSDGESISVREANAERKSS